MNFLRQGEKIQVIVVRIKYSHALAAIVTHSLRYVFLIACLLADMYQSKYWTKQTCGV